MQINDGQVLWTGTVLLGHHFYVLGVSGLVEDFPEQGEEFTAEEDLAITVDHFSALDVEVTVVRDDTVAGLPHHTLHTSTSAVITSWDHDPGIPETMAVLGPGSWAIRVETDPAPDDAELVRQTIRVAPLDPDARDWLDGVREELQVALAEDAGLAETGLAEFVLDVDTATKHTVDLDLRRRMAPGTYVLDWGRPALLRTAANLSDRLTISNTRLAVAQEGRSAWEIATSHRSNPHALLVGDKWKLEATVTVPADAPVRLLNTHGNPVTKLPDPLLHGPCELNILTRRPEESYDLVSSADGTIQQIADGDPDDIDIRIILD